MKQAKLWVHGVVCRFDVLHHNPNREMEWVSPSIQLAYKSHVALAALTSVPRVLKRESEEGRLRRGKRLHRKGETQKRYVRTSYLVFRIEE
jgi:hypothetical protein